MKTPSSLSYHPGGTFVTRKHTRARAVGEGAHGLTMSTKHREERAREGRASGRAEHAGAHRSGGPSGVWGALWSGDIPDPTSMHGRTAAATGSDSGTCSGLDQAGLTRGRHSTRDVTVVERGTVEQWSAVPTRQGLARAWHSTRTGVAALTVDVRRKHTGSRPRARAGGRGTGAALDQAADGRTAGAGLARQNRPTRQRAATECSGGVQSAQVGWEPTLTWSAGLKVATQG